jgi:hypothetical protein
LTALAAMLGWAVDGSAHPGHEDGPSDESPLAQPWLQNGDGSLPKPKVTTSEKDGYRLVESNGIPDHPTGRFPNRGNPNTIQAQSYSFRLTLTPRQTDRPTPVDRGALFGVAVNGVVFDPGTAEYFNNDRDSGWRYEALTGAMNLGIDQNRAHVQPNGAYHYHGIPTGLIDELKAKANAQLGGTLVDRPSRETRARDAKNARPAEAMLLVGWAADGFPVYGPMAYAQANDVASGVRAMKSSYRVKAGNRPAGQNQPGGRYDGSFTQDWEYVAGLGDLDECNGRVGVTPEYPNGTYYYVLTEGFPMIPRMWKGTPDNSFFRRGPGGPAGPGRGGPGGPSGPGGGPGGRGPRGPQGGPGGGPADGPPPR